MLQKRPLLSLLLKPEHSRAHGDKRVDVRIAQHAFDSKEQSVFVFVFSGVIAPMCLIGAAPLRYVWFPQPEL